MLEMRRNSCCTRVLRNYLYVALGLSALMKLQNATFHSCEQLLDAKVYNMIRSRVEPINFHGYERMKKCDQIFFRSVRDNSQVNRTASVENYAKIMQKKYGTGFIDHQFPDAAYHSIDFGFTTFPSKIDCSENRQSTSEVYLSTMVTVDGFRKKLIQDFLDYYIELGIRPENILLTIHIVRKSKLDQILQIVEEIVRREVYYDIFIGNWSSEAIMFHQAHKLLHCTRSADWIIVADSDEFHEYPTKNISSFFEVLDSRQINVVNGLFLDRLSDDGALKEPNPHLPIFGQFIMGCRMQRFLSLGTPKKVMAFKGNLRINRGHHRLALCWFWSRRNYLDLTPWKTCPPHASTKIRPMKGRLNVHHFKWMKGQYEATLHKADVWKGTPVGAAYKNVLEHIERCDGICVQSPEMKCRRQNVMI